MKRNLPVTKNQKLTATIMDLTYQGMGVAKVDGYSLFCDDALPKLSLQRSLRSHSSFLLHLRQNLPLWQH